MMTEAALIDALEVVSNAKNYHRWIYDSIRDHLGSYLLETGSGFGDLAPHYLEGGQRKVILSDRSEKMLARLKERYHGLPNLEFKQWDVIESCDNKNLDQAIKPDTIISINVLEHIEDDLRALSNMREAVAEAGKLILFVPAMPSLYGSLDRMAGHYRRYTADELKRKLNQSGWHLELLRHFNIVGVMTWFLGAKILKKTELDLRICRILDQFVPILAKSETLLRPGIGQSIIGIAVKKITGRVY